MPEPGTGDVLVRSRASFTPTELTWTSTWVDRRGHDRRPVIPGHEVSGIVEALGFGTTRFAVGDAVYGLTDWYRDGALADYVAVEGRNLAPKPASLDHVQAAALPMPGLTAWQALFVHGGLPGGADGADPRRGRGSGEHGRPAGPGGGRPRHRHRPTGARDLVTELGAERFVDLDRERFEDVAQRWTWWSIWWAGRPCGGPQPWSGRGASSSPSWRIRGPGRIRPAGPAGVLRGGAGPPGTRGAGPPGRGGGAPARGGGGVRSRRRGQGVPGQARRGPSGEGGAADLGRVSTGHRDGGADIQNNCTLADLSRVCPRYGLGTLMGGIRPVVRARVACQEKRAKLPAVIEASAS